MKKVVVLYVEGEPSDVTLLRRALRFAQLPIELLTVSDAQFAIEWLKGSVPYDDRVAYPLPELIITELKLPQTSGFELLRFTRGDARFRELPVVVFSNCEFETEAENSVRLGALAFFRKTNCCSNLLDFLRGWLAIRWDEIDAERGATVFDSQRPVGRRTLSSPESTIDSRFGFSTDGKSWLTSDCENG